MALDVHVAAYQIPMTAYAKLNIKLIDEYSSNIFALDAKRKPKISKVTESAVNPNETKFFVRARKINGMSNKTCKLNCEYFMIFAPLFKENRSG